jgi:hypothetical protein
MRERLEQCFELQSQHYHLPTYTGIQQRPEVTILYTKNPTFIQFTFNVACYGTDRIKTDCPTAANPVSSAKITTAFP